MIPSNQHFVTGIMGHTCRKRCRPRAVSVLLLATLAGCAAPTPWGRSGSWLPGLSMRATAELWLADCGTAIAAVGMAYTLTTGLALLRRPVEMRPLASAPPPTTILKPLCGHEPGLYERLRSFCELPTRELQIVCGVADAHDPALGVVRRLQNEFVVERV